jgi:8-oxo-dGTP pyrophosphatase MutT (NUDIX family)
MINLQKIKSLLHQVQEGDLKYCPPLPGLDQKSRQPAAVLIPLFKDQEKWMMLFIKRTHHQRDRHSGQIAFPGGRADQHDPSLLDTALRETQEEIGIPPRDIDILGQSCPINTVTGYEITPFVGLIPWPYSLQLSPIEVEKTVVIPVSWLVDPTNHQVKSWKSRSNPRTPIPAVFFDEYQGEILWGATAQIVIDFLELIQVM